MRSLRGALLALAPGLAITLLGCGFDGLPGRVAATASAPDESPQSRASINELIAIDACQGFVDAQIEYATHRQEADFSGNYSLTLISDESLQNHGYYYRMLYRQGDHASGGAREYLENGLLTYGFALVAWPASRENGDVMTFIVNQDGIVFQKDLGKDTRSVVAAMDAFEPDGSWTAVVEETSNDPRPDETEIALAAHWRTSTTLSPVPSTRKLTS